MPSVSEEVATCPKGHGPLRKDAEGIAVCVICGYEQPPNRVPSQEDDSKLKEKEAVMAGQGFRYPEHTKIQAVRDLEHGATKREVMRRVGCAPITLEHWQGKYGKGMRTVPEKGKDADSLRALNEMLAELAHKKFNLARRISGIEAAIRILEMGGAA